MAIHLFDCSRCGVIELDLKMSDIPLRECPKCKSVCIEKVFAPTSSIWKCSGACGKTNKTK